MESTCFVATLWFYISSNYTGKVPPFGKIQYCKDDDVSTLNIQTVNMEQGHIFELLRIFGLYPR